MWGFIVTSEHQAVPLLNKIFITLTINLSACGNFSAVWKTNLLRNTIRAL